jgi:PDZ domain-containing protein/aspartyl protease
MLAPLLLALATAPPATRFEITNNKTFVQVKVDGSAPQWFIFDTGNNNASVIARECADRLRLDRGAERKVQVGAGSGAPTGLSQLSRPMRIEALGETLTVAEPIVFDLDYVSRVEGRRANGLVGADFLARHVVAIDYARSTMTVHDPKTYEPPRGAVVLPLMLDLGWPVVEGTVTMRGGTPISCRVIVDTGMRGTLTLFRPYSERHGLYDHARLRNFVLGSGAGGLTRGDIDRVDSLTLGSLTFRQPVISYARDATGIFSIDAVDGIMGGELLRRHRVTFDCPHQRMILEPYATPAGAFEADMSGLFLATDAPDYKAIRVLWVNPGTPAEEAKLQVGDEIVSIDGRKALSLDQARELFRTPGTRRLEIRREGQSLQVQLEVRRLV